GDGSAVIEGNRIGVAADGSPLGNGGAGVSIENTSGNRVGGPFIPSANVIAFNAGPGVRITGGASAAGNAVPGNSIHENGGLGIDLGDDGYTGRDPLDADAGPNGLQNAPVVVALTPSAGGIGYVARVRLSSAPSTTYRVELFETAAESDPSGSGEGTFFLNGYVVTTDAAGEAVLEVPVFALRAGGNRVSATATAPDGSTSEFSNALGADGFAPAGGLAAPSRPMLAAASDTGASDADGITADATPTYVGTAAPGTTVHLMVDGYRCGAAVVGDDGTYAVTPDAALADRANRVVTAFVSAPGFAYSPVSDASFVTIDTAGPRVTFRPPGGLIAPTPVNAVPFDFDEPVTGIGAGDVAVALDGAPLALPAGYAPAATGPRSGVASLLFTYPQSPGAYTISLAAGAVTDVAGNPSAAGSATFYAVTGGGNVAAVATTRTTVEGSPTPARFTLVRAAAAGQGLAAPLTVNLTVVSQGYVLLATPGADYAALPASVTFPAGASTVTVDVLAADDAVYDPNEGVGLLVQPGPGVVTSGTPAFVRITDPTPPVVATIDPLPVLTTVLPTVTIRLSRAVTSLSGAVRVGGKVVADAQLSTPDGGSTWVVTGLSAQTEFPGNYKVQVSTVVVAAADGKQALMNGATAEYNLLYPTSVQLMPGPRSPLGVIDAAYAQVNNPPLGLALSDFVLTRGADPTNLLAGAPPEVALSTDPLLTITGLSAVATEPGDYRLTLRPWAAIPDGLGGFVHEVVDATWTVPPPPPPVLALRAPADAQVRDGTYAGTNYGAAATVEVRRSSTAGSTREGYVRFDLTGVAAADLITSVKVRLYGKLSAAGSVPVGLFPVADAAWAESGLKWSNKPAAGATPLATRTVGSTAGAWFEFDVTAYVREQKRAGAGGVSFALKATAAAGVQVLFNTDESSANRPELKVTQGPPPVGIAVSSSAVTVGEGKAAGLTVKLAAKPAASVVVTVARTSGDGDLSASPTKLTFTPANWDVAQTVTLAAAQDADTSNGTATFTLSGVGLTARTFAATEADDDRVLRAAADSYVRDGSTAGTNYGGGGSLFVRASATAGSTRWTVLKFDLTKAATVSSATLRLFGKVESTAAASVKVQAFAASSSSWTEGGVTWNNKPAPTGSSLGEATVSGTAAKWYAIDLTSWLQSLKAAGKTTAALVLTSPAATTAAAVFNSDEAAGSRPELLVRA
ncbi:MAG TPA: DNRLRE domain-containing protein, partial [Humisphaera sp.]